MQNDRTFLFTLSCFLDASLWCALSLQILRKERAVGLHPGGDEMTALMPNGHGSKKLKKEALDECVLRVGEALMSAKPPITFVGSFHAVSSFAARFSDTS